MGMLGLLSLLIPSAINLMFSRVVLKETGRMQLLDDKPLDGKLTFNLCNLFSSCCSL